LGIYHDSVIVEPYIICNRVLLPFSSYHLLLLRQAKSPFLSEKEVQATEEDLARAILICTTSFRQHKIDSLKPLKSLKSYKKELKKITRRIYINNIKKRFFKNIQSAKDAQDYIVEFYQYITAHLGAPTYKPSNDSGPSAIEPVFSVVACMMNSMGFGEEDAWDLPLSRANAYRGYVMEINGSKLLSEDDVDSAKKAKDDIDNNKQWQEAKKKFEEKRVKEAKELS